MSNSRRHLLIAIVILLVAPLSSRSQPLPELLQPVEKKSLDNLLTKSNYGLRSQLYFAKRYRIVQINFSVLEQEGIEFTITPFDDLQMKVAAKQISGPSSFEQLREWSGELVSPEVVGDATDYAGRSVELPRFPVNLWIRSGDHEVPLKLVRKIAAERGEKNAPGLLPDISDAPSETEGGRVFTKLPLRTLSGQWLVPARATQIVIEPVEDDPRFHLIYEEDQDKTPQGSHSPSDDTTRKLERREQFMKQLEEERARESAGREN